MEIEVPVEKNTISKHNLGFGFEDANINNTTKQPSILSKSGSGDSTGVGDDEFVHKLPRMMKMAVVGESTVGKTCICENICGDYPVFSEKYRLTCGVEIYAKTLNVLINSSNDKNNDGKNETDGNNPDYDNSSNEIQSSRLIGGGGGGNKSAGGSKGGRKMIQQEQSLIEKVNLILLDTSGKDLYIDLLPKYWGKLDGMILVIDLTSKQALENAVPWLELAQTSLAAATTTNDGKTKIDPSGMKTSVLIGNKKDLKEQVVIKSTTAAEFAKKYGLEYFECSVKENIGIQEAFQYIGKAGLNQVSDSYKKYGKSIK